MFAHFSCVLHQLLFLEDFEHGDGSGAAEVVAAECGAKHSINRLELWTTDECAHGVAVADAFRHRHDVGFDAAPLVGEEFARTAVSALNLVEDKHHATFLGEGAELVHKFVGWNLNAAHALNALDNYRCHIAFGDFSLHGIDVAERHDGHVRRGIDGGLDFGIVGGFNGKRGATVERLAEGDYAWLASVERCQLHRVFVGFRA